MFNTAVTAMGRGLFLMVLVLPMIATKNSSYLPSPASSRLDTVPKSTCRKTLKALPTVFSKQESNRNFDQNMNRMKIPIKTRIKNGNFQMRLKIKCEEKYWRPCLVAIACLVLT